MNDPPRSVRKRAATGGDAACPDDRRVQRTKRALVAALAGALFALLRWWLEHDSEHDAAAMDTLFHAIRLPA